MAATAAANLRALQRQLESLPRKWAKGAAKGLKKQVLKPLQADTGGDASLSGAPSKLRIDTKVTGDRIVTLTVSPGPKRSMGQWSWLEDGTRPHAIGKGRHPGTAAKRTWSKTVVPVVDVLITEAREQFGVAVRRS